ncbi:conserved hypothetical protein [Neospora caninum Liverpool]|uniref:Transmembrane protein n=1 Tax=Neospora caninum (strain Liverpool) TaxID=572307 RepID=F0VBR6_NEOCL|nr:conserved hypothetical protein [Neospora caninum Liverpool]CBZ51050.1 conserved hypothetical protein [Neospora caninum Liverpool]CEL68356.1 TPA: hypothetical protein BN1204_041250 [Neospora caninum Liverpool]|eukprot:XP_003881083.1 conserved hypothetical protein [Neospora caninum Liverpool]
MHHYHLLTWSFFLISASVQCEGIPQPARTSTTLSELSRSRTTTTAQWLDGTTDDTVMAKIIAANTGDEWDDSSPSRGAQDCSALVPVPRDDSDPRGTEKESVLQKIRDVTAVLAFLLLTLLASRLPGADRQRNTPAGGSAPLSIPGGYRRRLAAPSSGVGDKGETPPPAEPRVRRPPQQPGVFPPSSSQIVAPPENGDPVVEASLSRLRISPRGDDQSSHRAHTPRSTGRGRIYIGSARPEVHAPMALAPSPSSPQNPGVSVSHRGASRSSVACRPGWTCAGLDGKTATLGWDSLLPSGDTIWEDSVRHRFNNLIEREASRQALVMLANSSKMPGIDRPPPTTQLDSDILHWMPSGHDMKKTKADLLRLLSRRQYDAAFVAHLLVSPALRHYGKWLVDTERAGTRELKLILDQMQEQERTGQSDKDARSALEQRLSHVPADGVSWEEAGPSPVLLQWLGEQYMNEIVNPLPQKRRSRQRLSRQVLFSLPSLASPVLPAIKERRESGDEEEAAATYVEGAVSPSSGSSAPPAGDSSGVSTPETGLEAALMAFSTKEKIVLRKEIPGFQSLLQAHVDELQDDESAAVLPSVRQQVFQQLGEKIFAKKLSHRSKLWMNPPSKRQPARKGAKGLEAYQNVPETFWTDPFE